MGSKRIKINERKKRIKFFYLKLRSRKNPVWKLIGHKCIWSIHNNECIESDVLNGLQRISFQIRFFFFLNFTYFFKRIVPRYCTFSIYVVHFQHCMSNVEWSCTIQLGVSILDEFLNSIFSKTTPVTKKLYSLFSQFIFLSKITTFTEAFYILT